MSKGKWKKKTLHHQSVSYIHRKVMEANRRIKCIRFWNLGRAFQILGTKPANCVNVRPTMEFGHFFKDLFLINQIAWLLLPFCVCVALTKRYCSWEHTQWPNSPKCDSASACEGFLRWYHIGLQVNRYCLLVFLSCTFSCF